MTSDSDLKTQALTNATDFYDLLSIPSSAQAHEIRRAYRKTAPKYHPDKVGNDPAAVEKFYLVQIAYDVLSDPAVRELYDNARKARLAKVERDGLLEGRRREMKLDLERRESGAVKRRRMEVDEEEVFARELRRLAEDGKRRRKEREEALRREAEEVVELEKEGEGAKAVNGSDQKVEESSVSDLDRSLTLRFPLTPTTTHLNSKAALLPLFTPFGSLDEIILREKKLKPEGEKHRKPHIVAVIVYQSIVGAHAAMTDFPARAKEEPEKYALFETLEWAGGKEPEGVPKMRETATGPPDTVKPLAASNGSANVTPKAPFFSSFKTAGTASGPSLDETTMMRLKNAERRRMEGKIRKEEAAATETAAAGGGDEGDGMGDE